MTTQQKPIQKKIFDNLDNLQVELNTWIDFDNRERTHQGKRCQDRTPMQTFTDGMELSNNANLENESKLTAETKNLLEVTNYQIKCRSVYISIAIKQKCLLNVY